MHLFCPLPEGRRINGRTQHFFASAEDFIHGFSFCQFIDQLVKITDFPHQRFLDVFHPYAADDTFDQCSVGIQLRGVTKKVPVTDRTFRCRLDFFRPVAGESADHLVDFLHGPPLFHRLIYQQRINLRKTHTVYFLIVHFVFPFPERGPSIRI